VLVVAVALRSLAAVRAPVAPVVVVPVVMHLKMEQAGQQTLAAVVAALQASSVDLPTRVGRAAVEW
jgi:hypothetical protein